MKRTVLFFILVVTGAISLHAQTSASACPCCTDHYKEFDFWLGEWEVYDTLGTKVGENVIQALQDGCVLQENWTSSTMTGTSYNYYNAADSTWNQLWLDNQGGSLLLVGAFQEDRMVLESELLKGQRVDWYFNRIIWIANDDGSVTQNWQILDEKGQLLSTAFKGIYRKK